MIVTLLTDYGHDDEFVGVCHGVIRMAFPAAHIVDLSHGVARHDVRGGALVLRNALPYLPVGVHVGVVDPGVGTDRRALALRCADGRLLVGPDNGLLSLAWERAGGVVEAVEVSRSPHRLEPVSATFHGRDVFAPVAARLAAGAALAEAGDPLDPGRLEAVELPVARIEGDAVVAHALAIDRFGNVSLNVGRDDLAVGALASGRAVEIESGGERFAARVARSFADARAGETILYEDSYRALAIAVNRGDAAATLRLEPNAEVRLSPR